MATLALDRLRRAVAQWHAAGDADLAWLAGAIDQVFEARAAGEKTTLDEVLGLRTS